MFLEENVPSIFQHSAFAAQPHVGEAAAYTHPVSQSLGLALVKESVLPDIIKSHPQSPAQGTASVTYFLVNALSPAFNFIYENNS